MAGAAVTHPRLLAGLVWRRIGPLPVAGVLLLATGCALNFISVPRLEAATARHKADYASHIAALNTSAPSPTVSTSLLERRHAGFMSTLTEKEAAPNLLKLVFAEARKQGVTLAQAEYRLVQDKNGGFYAYQMLLPVKGPYPKLREFIDRILESVPNAALEDIAFKRDAVGAAATDARLRFVFYLKEAGT